MHLVVIFFLTFGYIGLEIVSVELDDPFGGKLIYLEASVFHWI